MHSGAVLPEEWHPQQQVMLPNSKMKLTQSILGVFSICFAQNEQGLALRAPTRIDKPRKNDFVKLEGGEQSGFDHTRLVSP